MIQINDSITADNTENYKQRPEVDNTTIDWDDKNDVMNAAGCLSKTLEITLMSAIKEIANDPYDGSSRAMLLSVSSFYAAMNRLYASFAPVLSAVLVDAYPKWVEELAGAENPEQLDKLLPDLKALKAAMVKSKALDDRPVIVHLEDADRDVTVEGNRLSLMCE
ncbi:hypothetical protein [Bifidobacterium callitrichidarum]|uniref:Uncharacterized protein n=1 Tax=Bifidobacterium callitrichidarum TaxID=2052941 RepID=A0A2U2N991_9BIFI|nr:hypothetical protein [Bifidobacterium callitrichidarum]PWG65579.1 hypothetical protein DF196_06490 [Bifidobacterium callitrichidarum]